MDAVRKLEGLPGWTWDTDESAWEAGYEALQRWWTRHGTLPRHADEIDGYLVGSWVAVQRQAHRRGDMGADREERLTSLSWWTWKPHETKWEEAFRHLQEYRAEHGDTRVPTTYRSPDGYPLGTWAAKQRRDHLQLSADRQRHLDEIGFTWATKEEDWERGFQHVAKYLSHHGTAEVPVEHIDPEDGYRTGSWVNLQRNNHREGIGLVMKEGRFARLEALPGWRWATGESNASDSGGAV
jgi:hypothetical protein